MIVWIFALASVVCLAAIGVIVHTFQSSTKDDYPADDAKRIAHDIEIITDD